MTTRGNSTKGASRRSSKPVIEHDPLALEEENAAEDVEEVPVPVEASAPKKKVAKKKATKKKTARKKTVPKESEANEEEQEMATPSSDVSESNSFNLGESLTIMEVADIHQQLVAVLDKGSAVSLTAKDVENIDGAGLQLLAAFVKDAGKRGIAVNWSDASDTVREAAGQVGLTDRLGLS